MNKDKIMPYILMLVAFLVCVTLTVVVILQAIEIKHQQQEIGELSKAAYQNAIMRHDSSTMSISDLDINLHISEEDVIILAKMVYGESRGVRGFYNDITGKYVTNTEQIAACMWSVLNRVDSGYGDNIYEVVTAPNQYIGYSSSNPVQEDFAILAHDVLLRWQLEKILSELGISADVGRTLPAPTEEELWCWFKSDVNRSGANVFRSKFKNGQDYNWTLNSPYSNDI